METIWYGIVTLMLAGYVVLDGFDFGVGIVYLWAARTDVERRTALAAIGPVWNGNEVWLLAGGGLLFFAFPKAYAAGLSPMDEPPGILDWYTVLMGIVSAVILSLHGASYLILKTEGEISRRAARAASHLGWAAVVLTAAALVALPFVQPTLRHNFADHPVGYLLPTTGALALGALLFLRQRGRDLAAFAASSLFIIAMLGSAALCPPRLPRKGPA